ncbi:hypothetical protein ACKKBG_A08880 [Auxenochlorella protothecoides x Auxenochlorella symbiontica]
MSRLQRFPLMTRREVEDSPSLRDGVSHTNETRTHKTAIGNMMRTAANFQMSIFVCGVAVILYRRFYTQRSLRKNNSYIMAAACLFLASKISDEPRSHQQIAAELLKEWYGRPLARARLQADPDWTARLFATVLDGECLLLHTVGFDFDVDLVHSRLVGLLRSPRFRHLLAVPALHQQMLSSCNDILVHDSGLLLEYSAGEVALTILYFFLKLHRQQGGEAVAVLEGKEDAEGRPWFVQDGLAPERCQAIVNRFMEKLYSRVGGGGAAEQGGAAGADSAASSQADATPGMAGRDSRGSAAAWPGPEAREGDGGDGAAAPGQAATGLKRGGGAPGGEEQPPKLRRTGDSPQHRPGVPPRIPPGPLPHPGPQPDPESSPEEGELPC